MSLFPSASEEATVETALGVCSLTYSPLNVDEILKFVQDDGAGAIALFIGTTRNSFQGKTVTRLEYQAYSKLAIKTMADIIHEAVANIEHSEDENPPQVSPSIIRTAVHHRLGSVSVGEPSIVIAVSSPHRRESFVACEFILESVKRKAQIWKREYYEGEPDHVAEWKVNK
ncbi:hypothetical protein H0H93_015179 [Arthromyces matolae]|nr:hypothetical protein H0H93_015179 [Arthromyces matolae]